MNNANNTAADTNPNTAETAMPHTDEAPASAPRTRSDIEDAVRDVVMRLVDPQNKKETQRLVRAMLYVAADVEVALGYGRRDFLALAETAVGRAKAKLAPAPPAAPEGAVGAADGEESDEDDNEGYDGFDGEDSGDDEDDHADALPLLHGPG